MRRKEDEHTLHLARLLQDRESEGGAAQLPIAEAVARIVRERQVEAMADVQDAATVDVQTVDGPPRPELAAGEDDRQRRGMVRGVRPPHPRERRSHELRQGEITPARPHRQPPSMPQGSAAAAARLIEEGRRRESPATA